MHDAETITSAIISLISAVCDAIRESGPAGASTGGLYAMLQTQGCTLKQYVQLESLLIESGRVQKRGELLIWVH